MTRCLLLLALLPLTAHAGDLSVVDWRGQKIPTEIRPHDPVTRRSGDVVARGTTPLVATLPAGPYVVRLTPPGAKTPHVFPVRLGDAALRVALDLAPPEGQRFVPAGPFIAGGGYDGPMRPKTRVVTLTTSAFYVDTHEITNARYRAFLQTIASPIARRARLPRMYRGNRDKPSPGPPDVYFWPRGTMPEGHASYPVRGLSCDDALAFAIWAGARLLREAEWEKVARGVDGRKHPWGNDTSKLKQLKRTYHPIGANPLDTSPYGVRDMASGVHEWTYSPGRFVSKGSAFGHVALADDRGMFHAGYRSPAKRNARPYSNDKGIRLARSALAGDAKDHLDSQDFAVRLAALQRLQKTLALPGLARMLADPVPLVRAAAAHALASRGEPGQTALLAAIADGSTEGPEAFDAVWSRLPTDATLRTAAGALWTKVPALGAQFVTRAARDCDYHWRLTRYLPATNNPHIRAHFQALLKAGKFTDIDAFVVDPKTDLPPLARALAARRLYARALLAYRRAGLTPPAADLARWRPPRNSLDRAMLFAARGDHASAVKRLRRKVEGKQRSVRALLELVRSLRALGQTDEAARHLERADATAPYHPEVAALEGD